MTSENMLYHLTLLMFQPEVFLTQEAGTSEGPKNFWAIHGAAHQGWAMSPMPPLPSSSGLIRKLLIKVLSANLEIERIVSRLQDLNVFFVI